MYSARFIVLIGTPGSLARRPSHEPEAHDPIVKPSVPRSIVRVPNVVQPTRAMHGVNSIRVSDDHGETDADANLGNLVFVASDASLSIQSTAGKSRNMDLRLQCILLALSEHKRLVIEFTLCHLDHVAFFVSNLVWLRTIEWVGRTDGFCTG